MFAQGFNEGWSYLMRVAGRAKRGRVCRHAERLLAGFRSGP